MRRLFILTSFLVVLSSAKSMALLNPFCYGPTLFGPCGIGSVVPGAYLGVTFPPGYWPPYFATETRYAAIAYSESGRYGASWNFSTLGEAEASALDFCGLPDCYVRVWSVNGCASIAVNENNRSIAGWAWNNYRSTANQNALYQCRARGGEYCQVLVSACNGW